MEIWTLNTFGLFVAGLLLWKITYRLFRSPLSDIPGPWLAKVTGWYDKYYLAHGMMYLKLKELHDEYGPIVQFGPNQVSVNTKRSVDILYRTSVYEKSEMYLAFGLGGTNTLTESNRLSYNSRKRIVLKIFSPQNLKRLEPMIKGKVLVPFVEKLMSSNTCDIYEVFHSITFDIIGNVLFSCNFDLVRTGNHQIVHWLRDAQFYSILKFFVPPVKYIKGCFGQKGYDEMLGFVQGLIDKRQKEEPKNDPLQEFLDAVDESTGLPFINDDVKSEMSILLMAAIDTTSNTLFWTLKLLLEAPEEMKKVVIELDAAFPSPSTITLDAIREKCPYLIAVFKESMRMHPGAAGQAPRVVPKGGAEFEGHYLPAGTECGVTMYAYHRSPLIWDEPDTFRPDRFLGPNKANDYSIPFLTGPRACLGREMAKMIMQLTLATLLRQFNVNWHYPTRNFTPIYHIILKPKEVNILITVTPRAT